MPLSLTSDQVLVLRAIVSACPPGKEFKDFSFYSCLSEIAPDFNFDIIPEICRYLEKVGFISSLEYNQNNLVLYLLLENPGREFINDLSLQDRAPEHSHGNMDPCAKPVKSKIFSRDHFWAIVSIAVSIILGISQCSANF